MPSQPIPPAKPKPAFDIEIDVARNLVCQRFCGHVSAAQLKAGMGRVAALLPQMRAGFSMLVDLSGIDAMDLDCVPHLAKVMDLCRAQGVALVVRVTPDPDKDIGFNILSATHYRGKVRVVTCETLAEAERALK
jgi:ABC-type transporter Mla MlaB component